MYIHPRHRLIAALLEKFLTVMKKIARNFFFISFFSLLTLVSSAQNDSVNCKYAYCKTDAFTDETTCFSDEFDGIKFMKTKKGSKEKIYIIVEAYGYGVTVDGKGVWIKLSNNKIISRQGNKVDVDANTTGSGFIYSSMFKLSKQEIALLCQNDVTDVKVYIYDSKANYGEFVKETLKCILVK